MAELTAETVAEDMFQLVSECEGKKKLKPGDLTKAMVAKYGDACTKDITKLAIRQLIESGRCVYAFVGGSFILLPPKETQG